MYRSLICVRVKGLLKSGPPFLVPLVLGEGVGSCDPCVDIPWTMRDTRVSIGQRDWKPSVSVRQENLDDGA